jgi:hypothetical protein
VGSQCRENEQGKLAEGGGREEAEGNEGKGESAEVGR